MLNRQIIKRQILDDTYRLVKFWNNLIFLFLCYRYDELTTMAKDNHGSVLKMAEYWGRDVRTLASKKRAEQTRYFKKVWLTNSSPHAIVYNVVGTDLEQEDRPMSVNLALVQTGLTTVKDVRSCLTSEEMYLNPAMYNLLCCGLESGKTKNGKKQSPSSLRYLITVAHEAHLRLELYLALKRQRYGKNPKKDDQQTRIKMWEQLCEIVYNDRSCNAETAELARLQGHGVVNAAVDDNEEMNDEEEVKPFVNKKYYM